MLEMIPQAVLWPGRIFGAASGTQTLDNTNSKLSQRIVPRKAMTLTAVNLRLVKTLSPGTVNFRIQTETSGNPSGTDVTNSVLSAITPSVATAGWNGALSFTGNVALSPNTAYHLLLEQNAGTFDATNKWGWSVLQDSTGNVPEHVQFNKFATGAWGTPTQGTLAAFVFTLDDSSFYGNPYHTSATTTRTFNGNTRVGLKFTLGAQSVVAGFYLFGSITALTSLGDLEVKVFDSTLTQVGSTTTIPGATFYGSLTTTAQSVLQIGLDPSLTLAAGTYWLSLHQAGNGSNNVTNSYRVLTQQSDYGNETPGRGSSNWGLATRTDDVSAWTVQTGEDACFGPIIESQSGGGGIYNPLGGGLVV